MPSDILGVSVFDQNDRDFHFHEGPVFTDILLADEINRASPRTQSALLEAMAEGQVSVDGNVRPLEELFFVIATQNPVESRGTYPLPEAQMDRFALQFTLGYVSPELEVEILRDQGKGHPIDTIRPCVSREDILAMKRQVEEVRISDELKRYIVDLVNATRSSPGVQLGASPRASLSLMKTAKALAMFDASPFVRPEHVQEIIVPVIAHRIMLEPQARFAGKTGRMGRGGHNEEDSRACLTAGMAANGPREPAGESRAVSGGRGSSVDDGIQRRASAELSMTERFISFLFRSVQQIQRWLWRRFTNAGRLMLGALFAAAVVGLDTMQSMAYQAFTLIAALLAVSLASGLFFRPGLTARRVLPRFGTVDESLVYRVSVENRSG